MMTTAQDETKSADTEAMPDLADEGDRPSITEVNGTVARFEMAYQLEGVERYPFGPPLRSRIPAIVWCAFSVAVASLIVLGYNSGSNTRLYMWVVERDHLLPPAVIAFLMLASGIGILAQTFMRGVIVQKSGIEARYLLPGGMPRVRRWAWVQVHRFIVDETDGGIVVELWTGEYDKLPVVGRALELAALLEQKAAQHGILVTRLASLKA